MSLEIWCDLLAGEGLGRGSLLGERWHGPPPDTLWGEAGARERGWGGREKKEK